MERRSFFKKLGIGAAALVVAPKIIEAAKETSENELSGFCIEPGSDFKLIRPEEDGGKVSVGRMFEESWQPNFITVTGNLKREGQGLYSFRFEGIPFVGQDVYIPAKCTNMKSNQPSRIVEIDGDICRIGAYDLRVKINGIKKGQKLVIGGSSFSSPEFVTRNFKTRSGEKWSITELKSFSS